MTGSPSPARYLVRRTQDVAALAAGRLAHHTPFAEAVRIGILLESTMRRAVEDHIDRVARLSGLASRRELLRLRERISALEYRIETCERDTGHIAEGRD